MIYQASRKYRTQNETRRHFAPGVKRGRANVDIDGDAPSLLRIVCRIARYVLRRADALGVRRQFLRESDRFLSVEELAAYLEVPVKTIYNWRHHNDGPRGFRVGKHLRFRWCDVQTCVAERIADES